MSEERREMRDERREMASGAKTTNIP